MDWKPIDEIPKDGTHVLVPDGLDVLIGWWGLGWRRLGGKARVRDFHVRADNIGQDGADDAFAASYYMEIPPPPTSPTEA